MSDYRKEPAVQVTEAPRNNLRRFLLSLTSTAAGIAVLLMGLSIYSNHYGYFGKNGQTAFYNDRLSKSEYLAELPAANLPNAYIIGSSNTMPIQVTTLDELYGVHSFNLGSFWGRAEEIWAWTNFLLRGLGQKPKLLVLGIEPWTFAEDNRGPPLLPMYKRQLISSPRLAVYLPHYHPAKARLSQVLDSLSIENERLLLRMFMIHKGQRSPQGDFWNAGFNRDGTNRTYSRTDPKPFLPPSVNEDYRGLVASHPTDREIDTLTDDRRKLVEAWHLRLDDVVNFLPGDKMSTERLELFERALDLLDDQDIPVAIVMMPTHPYYYDMLLQYTQHRQHLDFLRRFLGNLQGRHHNIKVVFDASHIARFGGDPFAFHDHFHMTPLNTDLMLRRMRAAQTIQAAGLK